MEREPRLERLTGGAAAGAGGGEAGGEEVLLVVQPLGCLAEQVAVHRVCGEYQHLLALHLLEADGLQQRAAARTGTALSPAARRW